MSDRSLKDDFNKTPLNHDLRFTCKNLTSLPLEKLKNYFGEAIALFFYFSNYKIYFSFFIGLFLIITDIVRSYNESNSLGVRIKKYAVLINSVSIIIWNNIFVEVWKRKERLWAIANGMNTHKD